MTTNHILDADARDAVMRSARALAPDSADQPDLIWQCKSTKKRVSRAEMPVPTLAYYLLTQILEYPLGDRGDKTHWAIPFRFDGHRVCLTSEKFGIRLYTPEASPVDLADRVLQTLNHALGVLEKHYLVGYAKTCVSSGQVIVPNQFRSFEKTYRYFRENAQAAFSKVSKTQPSELESILASWLNAQLDASPQGFYNTIAMLDAYFSRLEHALVFSLAFAGYTAGTDNVADFIRRPWADKFKRIASVSSNTTAKSLYDRLFNIKEVFRNTYAHGGFEKHGASLYIPLPDASVVPARLSDIADSPQFDFLLGKETTFHEICATFDEVDKWFREQECPYAWRLLASGLNVSFDDASLAKLHDAATSLDAFDEWIAHTQQWLDVYRNADY
jgi:hypothetical protein